MTSEEAIETAWKFLKAERQTAKECETAFRVSEMEVEGLTPEQKETWVVRFLLDRQGKYEGFLPAHIIVLVHNKTGETRFDDVL